MKFSYVAEYFLKYQLLFALIILCVFITQRRRYGSILGFSDYTVNFNDLIQPYEDKIVETQKKILGPGFDSYRVGYYNYNSNVGISV